jgi:Flp pilus assembly pilin Flp
MRGLIALIVIVYLVGVGVALAPTVETKWNSATDGG